MAAGKQVRPDPSIRQEAEPKARKTRY